MTKLNKGIVYIVAFVLLLILPWAATSVFNPFITVFVTAIISMGIYLLNVLLFLYYFLRDRTHNQIDLWGFAFSCCSSLLFFILKIDWIESQFYLSHTSVNGMLWLSAHIMSGFGHLVLQLNFLKK